MDRRIVLSYGGGRQTVALCVLIRQGVLQRPHVIVAADTSREAPSTWQYLDNYVRPMLAEISLEVSIASHDLATVDLWGHNGDLLIPAFTNTGKLPTFCSNEWKARVVQRWLTEREIRPVTCWIGFSYDETQRVSQAHDPQWYERTYPLIDLMLTRIECETIIQRAGLPLPHKSACWMCPHRSNDEWRSIRDEYPRQWQAAIRLESEIRAWDSRIYLHADRKPLETANIDAPTSEYPRQCGLGYCFI